MEDIILIGYGGHAKSVADCIERQGEYRIVGYTDMEEHSSKYDYLGTDSELQHLYEQGIRNAVIAVGYLGKGDLRERLYNMAKSIGFCLPVIRDSSSVISETALIGEGTFVGKGAIINAEAEIGKMAIINTMALVEHECRVGDFAHVAVSAVLCGNVTVGQAAFVGANVTVIQGRTIENHHVVPAGVTVR